MLVSRCCLASTDAARCPAEPVKVRIAAELAYSLCMLITFSLSARSLTLELRVGTTW